MRNKRKVKIRLIASCFILAAVAVALAVLVPAMSAKKASTKESLDSVGGNENTFSEVNFKSSNTDGKEVNLTADTVTEDSPNKFIFRNMVSTFTLPNREIGTIYSDVTKAIHADKTECKLIGNVKLSTESGFLLKTEKAFVDFTTNTAAGNTGVIITQDDMKLSAKEYFFDANKNELMLIKNAKGSIKSDKITSDKIIVLFEKGCGKSVKSLEAIQNASYVSLNYDLKAKHSIFYSGDKITAKECVVLLYKKGGKNYDIRSNNMNAVLDKKGVITEVKTDDSLIIKTEDATIRANKGVFKNDKIIVRGNVSILGDKGDIFGDYAELDVKTGSVFVNNSSGIVDDGKKK